MNNSPQTVYLIDGSSYIFRAFHAVRRLANSQGLPTNAVLGFTKMLLKLIQECKSEYIIMVFDSKQPTFRHQLYADYKANRPPMPEDLAVQIPYIRKITDGLGIPSIELPGYEADDVIGTLSKKFLHAGFSVVMVTGDKDFLQLVNENSVLWDPMKDKTTGIREIESEYKIPPEQMVEVMGFSGDSSDNIPGVPGIGPKTALSLIQQYKSLEGVYDNIQSIAQTKQREKLIAYKEQAFLSRQLVQIITDSPLPLEQPLDQLQRRPFNAEILHELFRELEFRQFQDLCQPQTQTQTTPKDYQSILDKTAFEALLDRLSAAERFAVDTETTSLHPIKAQLVGISFALEEHRAYYIPLNHDYLGAPLQLDMEWVLAQLKPILENPQIHKIGQNIKYDMLVFSHYGIDLQGVIFDSMIASYLINPSKRAHNLDQIALDELNYKKISYQEVAGKGKSALTFNSVSIEEAVKYAGEDADITLAAFNKLEPKIAAAGLTELMQHIEMPLIPVLMLMEKRGIFVDRQRLSELSKRFADQLESLEQRIYEIAGQEFNINSPPQLGHILFEKLQLPTKKKTKKKTGYSTDVDVLTELALIHELPALILRQRTLSRLKTTYTDALVELINPKTGRIHTSFNQSVTATGRLSSSDPNLQNIPIKTEEGREIRSAFIPQPGWRLIAADYSQIELRILAHYSSDENLIQAFMQNVDVHTYTAAEVFETEYSQVTPEQRRQAKTINFGIIYGMSAYGLAKELGISKKIAQNRIDRYFERYQGVKRFLDNTVEQARKDQKVTTLLGRIRYLPDISSPNQTVRGFAERTAINTPIQGSAADLIKAAMIRVQAEINSRKLQSAMLLTVHDELVFEAPPQETDELKTLLKHIMEQIWELNVPLKVNVDEGLNWNEAH